MVFEGLKTRAKWGTERWREMRTRAINLMTADRKIKLGKVRQVLEDEYNLPVGLSTLSLWKKSAGLSRKRGKRKYVRKPKEQKKRTPEQERAEVISKACGKVADGINEVLMIFLEDRDYCTARTVGNCLEQMIHLRDRYKHRANVEETVATPEGQACLEQPMAPLERL